MSISSPPDALPRLTDADNLQRQVDAGAHALAAIHAAQENAAANGFLQIAERWNRAACDVAATVNVVAAQQRVYSGAGR